MAKLPHVPNSILDDDGHPRFGAYRGWSPPTDLSAVSRSIGSTGQRFLREKKWQWFVVADERIACGGTLLDVGYGTTVFLWVFDRSSRRMLADHSELLPPFGVDVTDAPGDSNVAALRGLRRTFSMERDSGTLTIDVDFDDIRLEINVDETATTPLTAICPVRTTDASESGADASHDADDGDADDGDTDSTERTGVNVTQKQCCLPAEGRVYADGRSFRLDDDARGLLDYSHGLLARDTAWRWAIGGGVLDDGTPVGFNFSEGFNAGLENAVWLGETLQSTAEVTFDFDPDAPRDPWHIRSSDGAIDLTLLVEGLRRHQTDLRIVTSEYLQPLGHWHGRVVDREVHGLFGVAERHTARW